MPSRASSLEASRGRRGFATLSGHRKTVFGDYQPKWLTEDGLVALRLCSPSDLLSLNRDVHWNYSKEP